MNWPDLIQKYPHRARPRLRNYSLLAANSRIVSFATVMRDDPITAAKETNSRIVNYLFFMQNKSLRKLITSSAKGCLFSLR